MPGIPYSAPSDIFSYGMLIHVCLRGEHEYRTLSTFLSIAFRPIRF